MPKLRIPKEKKGGEEEGEKEPEKPAEDDDNEDEDDDDDDDWHDITACVLSPKDGGDVVLDVAHDAWSWVVQFIDGETLQAPNVYLSKHPFKTKTIEKGKTLVVRLEKGSCCKAVKLVDKTSLKPEDDDEYCYKWFNELDDFNTCVNDEAQLNSADDDDGDETQLN